MAYKEHLLKLFEISSAVTSARSTRDNARGITVWEVSFAVSDEEVMAHALGNTPEHKLSQALKKVYTPSQVDVFPVVPRVSQVTQEPLPEGTLTIEEIEQKMWK